MTSKESLTRFQSFQYPSAHLGHLSPGQQSALDEFKRICQEEGYFMTAVSGGVNVPSHDDETLLRFLRARRFVPADAFQQFKDTEDWRKENRLVELYETVDVKEYEETRRLYPQWTGRRDLRGIPVYLFEVAPLKAKAVAAYDKSTASIKSDSRTAPPKMLRLFALYENLTRFVMPLCSAIGGRHYPETPVSQSNNIVDISKVGLKQFWNLKSHMQDASTLATAHYPETLDRIFVIGAPNFFPTVWGWIKRWFDPITVSKIFILSSSDMTSTLEQYIDPANIPKKYGGTLDFEFGDMPNLEPEIDEVLQWQQPLVQKKANSFPTGPIKWEEGANGEMIAVAVGTENGKPRHTVVATLPKPFKTALHPVNTEVPELRRLHTGVGIDTHPPDEGNDDDDDYDKMPDFKDDSDESSEKSAGKRTNGGDGVEAPPSQPVTGEKEALTEKMAELGKGTLGGAAGNNANDGSKSHSEPVALKA